MIIFIVKLYQIYALLNEHKKTYGLRSVPLSSNTSSTCPHNMANFGPLTAEIGWPVWGTPANFNGFASWQRYCTALH